MFALSRVIYPIDEFTALQVDYVPRSKEELYRFAWDCAEKAVRTLRDELGVPYERSTVADTWICPRCDETTERKVGVFPPNPFPQCRCQRELHEKVMQEYNDRMRPKVVAVVWESCGIPRKFQGVTLGGFEVRPGAEKAVKVVHQYVKDFKPDSMAEGLILVGKFGSGKTHLALGAARELVNRHLMRVHFTSAIDLLTSIKANFNRDSDRTSADPLEKAKNTALLVLDDIGQEGGSDFDMATLFDLVDHRYKEGLPTIFTTNVGGKDLPNRVGGAVASRITEVSRGAKLEATDYREDIAKRRLG